MEQVAYGGGGEVARVRPRLCEPRKDKNLMAKGKALDAEADKVRYSFLSEPLERPCARFAAAWNPLTHFEVRTTCALLPPWLTPSKPADDRGCEVIRVKAVLPLALSAKGLCADRVFVQADEPSRRYEGHYGPGLFRLDPPSMRVGGVTLIVPSAPRFGSAEVRLVDPGFARQLGEERCLIRNLDRCGRRFRPSALRSGFWPRLTPWVQHAGRWPVGWQLLNALRPRRVRSQPLLETQPRASTRAYQRLEQPSMPSSGSRSVPFRES